MSFDVVDNLPMPASQYRPRKYNLDELNVGQALVIPEGTKHSASSIYVSARKLGIKVSVRELESGDVGVWRVA